MELHDKKNFVNKLDLEHRTFGAKTPFHKERAPFGAKTSLYKEYVPFGAKTAPYK